MDSLPNELVVYIVWMVAIWESKQCITQLLTVQKSWHDILTDINTIHGSFGPIQNLANVMHITKTAPIIQTVNRHLIGSPDYIAAFFATYNKDIWKHMPVPSAIDIINHSLSSWDLKITIELVTSYVNIVTSNVRQPTDFSMFIATSVKIIFLIFGRPRSFDISSTYLSTHTPVSNINISTGSSK